MIPSKLFLLMGAPAGAGAGGTAGAPSFISTLIPFALIIVIFYFFIIRPQNKKQKETQKMLEALKKGDRVVTIGGLHGVVQSAKEGSSTVILKVDDNTKLEFTRSAISSITAQGKEEKPEQIEEKKAGDGDGGES